MDPQFVPLVIDLSKTRGPGFLAVFLSVAVWGATCVQLCIYCTEYGSDPLHMKLGVGILWLVGVVHEVLLIRGSWNIFVPRFGDPTVLLSTATDFFYMEVPTLIVAFLAQCFFAWRLYQFSRSRFVFLLLPLIMAQIVIGAYFLATAIHSPVITIIQEPFMIALATSGKAIAAFVDVTIATVMCWKLLKVDIHFAHTKKLTSQLAVASFHTGFWTAVFSLATLILYNALPNEYYYSMPDYAICALYTNAVLANLNARNWMKSAADPPSTLYLSTLPGSNGANNSNLIGNFKTASDTYGGGRTNSGLHFKTTTTSSSED